MIELSRFSNSLRFQGMYMFNWSLFILIVLISLPGLIVSAPKLISSLDRSIRANLGPGQKSLSSSNLTLLTFAQNLVFILLAAAVGTALTPSVGLGAPFFQALIDGGPALDIFLALLPATVIVGIVGAVIFLAFYYLVARRRLDAETIKAVEDLRLNLGLVSRLLYGGIDEEVITRWGLMTLFVWVGTSIAGTTSTAVMWGAILISGILFGLGHLPAQYAAGAKRSTLLIVLVIGLNLWASLIFGWLFWQYGLFSAMLAHMLFHLVWYPLDLRYGSS